MKETEATYASATGIRIHRRVFAPESRPAKGILVLIHGLGEHTGRYSSIAEAMTEQCGLICSGVDLPGHGFSPGKRGHISSLEIIHTLVTETRDFLLSQLPDSDAEPPTILLGHSMGGLLALDYLNQHPNKFTHSWINSPPLAAGHDRSRTILAIARKLDRLWPSMTLSNKIRHRDCFEETDPAFVKTHTKHCHRRISARLGVLLMNAASRLNSDPNPLPANLHYLMTQGEADRICPPVPNKAFFDKLPIPDKTWHLFPNLLHECCRKTEVLTAATKWINAQLEKNS